MDDDDQLDLFKSQGQAANEAFDKKVFDWSLMQGAALRLPAAVPSPPSAQMIAFPARRRIGEIRRLAEQMSRLSCERGETHLQLQLRIKAEALRRRGFSNAQVGAQIGSLKTAVRAEFWREFGPSGSKGGSHP
jgi:hypothetical protein